MGKLNILRKKFQTNQKFVSNTITSDAFFQPRSWKVLLGGKMLEKKKVLVTGIFSFSTRDFLHLFRDKYHFLCNITFIVRKCYQSAFMRVSSFGKYSKQSQCRINAPPQPATHTHTHTSGSSLQS